LTVDVLASPYRLLSSFQEMLLQDSWHGFPLINTLLNLDSDTYLVEAIITFYDAKGRIVELLRAALHKAKSTKNFRHTTSMLICRIYMKHVCDTYLSQCLLNTYSELYVDTFVSDPDPKYIQKITSTLLTDLSLIPPPIALKKLFRDILRNENGPELISELYFNHLIIPAITSPPMEMIQAKPYDKNTAHVVSKMIYGLVTSLSETEDEGGSKPFVTQQNKNLVQTILSNLTSITKRREAAGVVDETVRDVPDAVVVGEAISVIRDGIVNNLEKLWEAGDE